MAFGPNIERIGKEGLFRCIIFHLNNHRNVVGNVLVYLQPRALISYTMHFGVCMSGME